jgi:magnesium transporter
MTSAPPPVAALARDATEPDPAAGPRFRAMSFRNDGVVVHGSLDDALAAIRAGQTTWIDLLGRTDENERLLGADGLRIHPLIIEDVFHDCVRPKVEDYPEYVYVLFHAPSTAARDVDPDTLDLLEIDLLFGPHWVVTHHAQESKSLTQVFAEVARSGRAIRRGAAWVAHAVLDRVVDDYLPLLDALDEEIDVLEKDVLADAGDEVLPRIFSAKRRLQQLRRVSIHQKEVLYRLSRGEFDEIPEALLPFFRDVHDHYVRVADLAESYRDLVGATFEAHLSVQSNKMNSIMKTLTLATTLFMPLTFISGVYGMNFEHMPELKKPMAYPIVLGVMGLIATSVLLLYRRKRWL